MLPLTMRAPPRIEASTICTRVNQTTKQVQKHPSTKLHLNSLRSLLRLDTSSHQSLARPPSQVLAPRARPSPELGTLDRLLRIIKARFIVLDQNLFLTNFHKLKI